MDANEMRVPLAIEDRACERFAALFDLQHLGDDRKNPRPEVGEAIFQGGPSTDIFGEAGTV
jgi:hypothetical protein